MDEDKGFGKCDELGTGGECEGCERCEECDMHTKTGEDPRQHRLTPVETFKTQPVRIRVSDIEVLQRLKESEDETPGTVIHRVLSGYNEFKSSDPSAVQQYIDKLNTIIANRSEEIETLQREIAERDAIIEDIKGDSLLEDDADYEIEELDDDEPAPGGIYRGRGTTINIIIGGK